MGIDRISSAIQNFSQEQIQLIREFYHLDYWDNHTLTEGFAEAAEEATDLVHEKLNGSHRLVQASVGAGLGVAKLLGAIPIGLLDWGMQIVRQVPNGPGKTLYKFLEVPVKGFYQGGILVFETAGQWAGGSLNNKDSYAIANEVTATLGTAAFLLFGSKKIFDGGDKFLSGIMETGTDLSMPAFNGMAVATATAAIGEIALAGGLDLLAGAVLMSSVGQSGKKTGPIPRVDDETLAKALEQHSGNQTKAAKKVGLTPSAVSYRIKRAQPGSLLEKFKEIKGGPIPRVDDETLAKALEQHSGNQTKAAKKVGLTPSAVSYRIKRAQPGSLLEKFKEIKKSPIDDERLAKALEWHGGNRTKTAKEVGLTPSAVCNRIKRAQPGSLLEKFKEIKGGPIPRIDDERLAKALEWHGGNRTKTAKEVGLTPSAVRYHIKHAQPDSLLEKFKEIKGGPIPRIDDERLAKALEWHGGNRTKAAKEVGLTPSAVYKRIKYAQPDSLLEKFKEIKGKRGPIPRVDDERLAKALKRHGGNRTKAAKEVGLTIPAVCNRIKRAQPDSLLEKFKEIKGGPIPRVDDERLAKALKRHGGNRTKTAKEVGLTIPAVCNRIKRAQPGSLLEKYKRDQGKK